MSCSLRLRRLVAWRRDVQSQSLPIGTESKDVHRLSSKVPPQDLEADLPWCKGSVSRPKSFSKPPLCVPNVCVCPNAFAKVAEISHYPSLHSRHMVFVPSFGNACRVSPSLYPHGTNVCRSDSDHDYAWSVCSVCVFPVCAVCSGTAPVQKLSPWPTHLPCCCSAVTDIFIKAVNIGQRTVWWRSHLQDQKRFFGEAVQLTCRETLPHGMSSQETLFCMSRI